MTLKKPFFEKKGVHRDHHGKNQELKRVASEKFDYEYRQNNDNSSTASLFGPSKNHSKAQNQKLYNRIVIQFFIRVTIQTRIKKLELCSSKKMSWNIEILLY